MEHLTFLTAAIKDRNVGAVAPTSPTSVKSICGQIDKTRPVVVVEYGPGTGAFSRYLLKHLHPDSTLIGIEMNRDFVSKLRAYRKKRKIRAPNFIVVRDDARNVNQILKKHGFQKADYVLSGIPFSFFDEQTKQDIVQNTREALSEEGLFLVYQYSFLMKKTLEQTFSEVNVGRCLLNLPPICRMSASGHLKRAESQPASAVAPEFIGKGL